MFDEAAPVPERDPNLPGHSRSRSDCQTNLHVESKFIDTIVFTLDFLSRIMTDGIQEQQQTHDKRLVTKLTVSTDTRLYCYFDGLG